MNIEIWLTRLSARRMFAQMLEWMPLGSSRKRKAAMVVKKVREGKTELEKMEGSA